MNKTLYDLLDVVPQADLEALRRSYHLMTLAWHPDRFPEDSQERAGERLREIIAAFEVLSDEEKRQQYDRLLQQQFAPPSPAEPYSYVRPQVFSHGAPEAYADARGAWSQRSRTALGGRFTPSAVALIPLVIPVILAIAWVVLTLPPASTIAERTLPIRRAARRQTAASQAARAQNKVAIPGQSGAAARSGPMHRAEGVTRSVNVKPHSGPDLSERSGEGRRRGGHRLRWWVSSSRERLSGRKRAWQRFRWGTMKRI